MNDDLSRLLAGELSPDEEEALYDRIAEDPMLAAEWDEMQDLPGLLADLPDEAPPADLDALVLTEDPPRISLARYAPWALAAAFILFAVWPAGNATHSTLLSGQQLVEGPAVVHLAGDVTVEIDGVAHIFVEPSPELVRVTGVKEKNMTPKHLLAAAAGAAITITVYEGTALISDSDAAPVEVQAGDTHRIDGVAAAEPQAEPLPTRTADITLPQALERIDELEAALARSEFEGALVEGRIVQHEGLAQSWPDHVPSSLQPDAFADQLRKALSETDDADLVELDCDEFPCIATLSVPAVGENENWAAPLEDFDESFEFDRTEWATKINASTFQINDDQYNYWTLAFIPRDETHIEVGERVGYRIEEKVEALSAELNTVDEDER
ncbi:MAG: hypothetical protein GY913_28825 [Proteobacteria bacterium]|nr:hypothetical protein [Pseudomonadota bacterium]MCP4920918.1 hypothetical protein [Pseudomonadota bacterium]